MAEEQKVKLRLYWGGKFEEVPESGEWRYVGGSVYNDAIPISFTYNDVIQRMNYKFNTTVQMKYQAPGEELTPDSLVNVTDEDDLKEFYEEYLCALSRPGTLLRTFRIRIFLTMALQTELEACSDADALDTDDMEASLCEQAYAAYEQQTWSSDDVEQCSAKSASPSTDTEMQLGQGQQQCAAGAGQGSLAQPPPAMQAEAGTVAGTNEHGSSPHGSLPVQLHHHHSACAALEELHVSVSQLTAGHASSPQAHGPHWSASGLGSDMARPLQQEQLTVGQPPAVLPRPVSLLHSKHPLPGPPPDPLPLGRPGLTPGPLAPSIQLGCFGPAPGFPRAQGFTAEDFSLDDPYHEPDDDHYSHHHPMPFLTKQPLQHQRSVSRLLPLMGRTSERQDQEEQAAGPTPHTAGPLDPQPAAAGLGPGQPRVGPLLVRGPSQAWSHAATAAAPASAAHGQQPMDAPGLFQRRGDALYSEPCDGVRDIAGGLPSHISIFGDSEASGSPPAYSKQSGCPTSLLQHQPAHTTHYSGPAQGVQPGSSGPCPQQLPNAGSLRLPSHISAFGEGDTGNEGVRQAVEGAQEAQEAERQHMQQLYGGTRTPGLPNTGYGAARNHHGQVVTQEFDTALGSSLQDCNPLLDFNFLPAATSDVLVPKALLESVPHVPRAQVDITAKIGEGAFGDVSKAEVFPYGTVAIKWLKQDRFAKYSESFQREAEVLARLNHPNIIRMFGLVTEPNDPAPHHPTTTHLPLGSGSSAAAAALTPGAGARPGASPGNGPGLGMLMGARHPNGTSGISMPATEHIAGIMMEYVRGGSLAQRFRAAALQGRRVPLRERCRIALQAALGMSYLHDQQPAVIHFDLKPDNLLVEGEGEDVLIKVADFGLSKHKFQTYVTCHDLRGTLPYMAPELVANPNKVCEKCDVWSMGVVMWEMLTLEVPFQELTAQQIIMGLMHGTLNLRTPRDCEPEWLSLIAQCMETSPVHRPAFRDLALRLENLGRSLDQQQQQYQQQLQAAAEAQAQALLLQQQMALHAQAQERERQAQIQHLQLQAAIQLQQQQQQQAVAAVAVATGLLPPPSPTLYHLGHHHHHHHDILTAQHQHQQQQQQLLNSVLRMANSPILYP